jgi:hypothetical protein
MWLDGCRCPLFLRTTNAIMFFVSWILPTLGQRQADGVDSNFNDQRSSEVYCCHIIHSRSGLVEDLANRRNLMSDPHGLCFCLDVSPWNAALCASPCMSVAQNMERSSKLARNYKRSLSFAGYTYHMWTRWSDALTERALACEHPPHP